MESPTCMQMKDGVWGCKLIKLCTTHTWKFLAGLTLRNCVTTQHILIAETKRGPPNYVWGDVHYFPVSNWPIQLCSTDQACTMELASEMTSQRCIQAHRVRIESSTVCIHLPASYLRAAEVSNLQSRSLTHPYILPSQSSNTYSYKQMQLLQQVPS